MVLFNSRGEKIYRRKELRRKTINYRYGWFFVSFNCAKNKSMFGAIAGESVSLNELGRRVEQVWRDMPKFHEEVQLDEFVVMPNHFHFIIKIHERPTNDKMHLGKLIRSFKQVTAKIYHEFVAAGKAPDIGASLWQKDFWERIITNHEGLEAARRYIRRNEYILKNAAELWAGHIRRGGGLEALIAAFGVKGREVLVHGLHGLTRIKG